MPLVPFETLPDDARVWVFAGDRPITGSDATRLLDAVDAYLARWKAHGEPLTVARTFTEDRFLTVAVDQRASHASGCSVDGLFRTLKEVERDAGVSLVGAGRVHYRDADGSVRSVERGDFGDLAAAGRVAADTPVFDPTVTTLGEWRKRFEARVGESWHAQLI